MSKPKTKTITFDQFASALEFSIEEGFRIDLTNYDVWLQFNEWKSFAWRNLDRRRKWHRVPVNKLPEPHTCPEYRKSIRLFGKQFYTKKES